VEALQLRGQSRLLAKQWEKFLWDITFPKRILGNS
jgi:hypothetical protein